MPPRTAVIAVVGAGPRGTSILERIGASAPPRRVRVHMIDPYPPGAGRVWRYEQSRLLAMNSMAEDVTMFTDETVECEGPVRPGPSLSEWAEQVRTGALCDDVADGVRDELQALDGGTFASRRLQSQYLAWFVDRVLRTLPPTVDVRFERARAVRIQGARSPRPLLWLEGRADPLPADVVVLAQGHLDVAPGDGETELLRFADEHGLVYQPPGYTADLDLERLRGGERVIVRGSGLAFVDLAVLLAEGRGGRYLTEAGGRLAYRPSGREPEIHVGSRRGLPYHAKINYRLLGEAGPARFWDAAAVDALLARERPVDFRADVWPLLSKEILWGHYRELFTGHPDRVAMPWTEFAAGFAALDADDPALAHLVAQAVPDPADRLDLADADAPLTARRFTDPASLQDHVRGTIGEDLLRRSDPRRSADLGAQRAMLAGFGQLQRLIAACRFTTASRTQDVEDWWQNYFNQTASGPPPRRLAELLALSEAGVVHFLGAGLQVRADTGSGRFLADGSNVSGTVSATGFVDARLPARSVTRTTDPLLRELLGRGDAAEELLPGDAGAEARGTGLLRVTPDEGRVVTSDGTALPAVFAVGPFTSNRGFAAFPRPGTNHPLLRINDQVARTVLARAVGGLSTHRTAS